MTKNEFMCILRANLNNFSNEEVAEILYDYEEHFNIGIANGKSESEIIEELGDPEIIAKQYSNSKASTENDFNSSNSSTPYENNNPTNNSNDNSSDKILTIILLVLLIIFGTGPILGVFGTLIGFLCAGIGMIIGGISMIISGTIGVFPHFFALIPLTQLSTMPAIAFILVSIGIIALGGLLLVGNLWLIKFLVKCIIKLFHWFKERLS